MQFQEVESVKQFIRSDVIARRGALAAAQAHGPVIAAHAGGAEVRPLPLAVGVGLTDTEDVFQVAIRVPDAATAERVRERYRDLIERYGEDINIEITGRPQLLGGRSKKRAPSRSSSRPLTIGMEVHHENGRRGTLGFFARLGKTLGFVSCNHVIGLTDGAKPGDKILDDRGDVIGEFVTKHRLRGFERALADCAFAKLVVPRSALRELGFVGDGRLTQQQPRLRQKMPVSKIGAGTGSSRGMVRAYGMANFEIDYDNFSSLFDDIVEIESTERDSSGRFKATADDGDSGALYFTDTTREPLGMIFFKTPGGPDNSGLIYANLFDNVTRALGVDIVV